jgi:hypothetical protein
VGPYRLPVSSPIQKGRERGVIVGVVVTDLEVVEHNLEGLTMHVPDTIVDDLPRHYQHHTVGISASIGQLLHREAQEVVYYREQHS